MIIKEILFVATPYLSYFKQKKTKTISKVADCIILDETYIKVHQNKYAHWSQIEQWFSKPRISAIKLQGIEQLINMFFPFVSTYKTVENKQRYWNSKGNMPLLNKMY